VHPRGGANVYAGIGAHFNADANVGWDNVGVSMDIGAALGVGAGLSFEVNWSPADTVSAIADVGGGLVEGAGNALSSGWNAVTSL
jgi:hypothetical protein